MPKEWILNQVMNRFQLNYKRNVGPTSESIRKCQPQNIQEWEVYYFSEVRSREHIEELGRKLFQKIKTVVNDEVASITEEDCLRYMKEMVIDRTYQGYLTEISIIRGKLEGLLDFPGRIEEAPDEWDRLYAVDFFIQIGEFYIGIQIKPETFEIAQTAIRHRELIRREHELFEEQYGGKAFLVISSGRGKDKEIMNSKVVQEIQEEINRLLGA